MAIDRVVLVDEPDPQPVLGFFIKCLKCSGSDIQVVNNMRRGSKETGVWGAIELRCRLCGYEASIYDA